MDTPEPPMLDLYFARTPNGMKLKLFMEELAELRPAPARCAGGRRACPPP